MAFYRIADFLVEINSDEVLLIKERFKTDNCSAAAPDISVTITDDDFKVFGSNMLQMYSREYIERIAACNRVGLELPKHGAVLLHGSAVYTGGRAVVFIADSGVGKNNAYAAVAGVPRRRVDYNKRGQADSSYARRRADNIQLAVDRQGGGRERHSRASDRCMCTHPQRAQLYRTD